jgi:hypothetical protein
VTTTANQPGTDVMPVVSQQTLALFASMAVGIPEADDAEAYENIVAQLLAADGVDALNAPWDTSTVDNLANHRLRIESMTRRQSDFAGGLGVYIVAKGVDMGTGETFVWTTGSVAIVAQLARIHHMGALPAVVELVVGDPSPTTGRRPQHLKVLSLSVAK